ncbi:hypothetical protein ACFL7D_04795 [candidate division KSB1 bacterium]
MTNNSKKKETSEKLYPVYFNKGLFYVEDIHGEWHEYFITEITIEFDPYHFTEKIIKKLPEKFEKSMLMTQEELNEPLIDSIGKSRVYYTEFIDIDKAKSIEDISGGIQRFLDQIKMLASKGWTVVEVDEKTVTFRFPLKPYSKNNH